MHKVLSDKKAIFFLVLPGTAIFLFVIFLPLVISFLLGFTDYNIYGEFSIVGLKNYIDIVFNDSIFWLSLKNVFFLVLGLIFIQHPIGLFFAVGISRLEEKLDNFFRGALFVPCVISVVVITKMWVAIYNYNFGLANKLLEFLGLSFLVNEWIGDPKTALVSLMIIVMWQGFGWCFLIYYAGVRGIPEYLYEAASIDGAAGMKLYWNITIPLLMPVIKVNTTLALISALKQMEIPYIATRGGPGNATQFPANYLYITAFNAQKYGYANALGIIFVVICLLVTYLNNRQRVDIGEF